MNGKGSKSRTSDIKKYRENFDEINWKKSVCPNCYGRNERDKKHCALCSGIGREISAEEEREFIKSLPNNVEELAEE